MTSTTDSAQSITTPESTVNTTPENIVIIWQKVGDFAKWKTAKSAHSCRAAKFELRHSYTSNGRQESVAEHTWRMSLMAVLIEPLLKKKIDTARLLKMIILHDLVEAEAKDISALDVLRNPEIKMQKIKNEKQAIENLRLALKETNGQEIYDLFYEFENKKTYEAKIANVLDKLEVQLQHNHADFSTWEEIEYDMCYMMDQHALFDDTLLELKTQIEDDAEQKMRMAGVDTNSIKQRVKG